MEAEDLFLLGRGLLGRGQVGPALASLGAARDEQPDHAETLDELSRYWAETRSMTDAVDAADRLRNQPGWEVIGSIRLARLRSELFDPSGAAELLTEALRRDPKLTTSDLNPAAARRLLAAMLAPSGPAGRGSCTASGLVRSRPRSRRSVAVEPDVPAGRQCRGSDLRPCGGSWVRLVGSLDARAGPVPGRRQLRIMPRRRISVAATKPARA